MKIIQTTLRHWTALFMLSCIMANGCFADVELHAADTSKQNVRVLSHLDVIAGRPTFQERIAAMYKEQPASSIVPTGWIAEFLRRMETGLTGHPEQSGFPFNTEMWAGEMNFRDREYSEYGSDWWPYEQTAYYLDGALRCGYLNRSKPLIERVRRNVDHLSDAHTRMEQGIYSCAQWSRVVQRHGGRFFHPFDADLPRQRQGDDRV